MQTWFTDAQAQRALLRHASYLRPAAAAAPGLIVLREDVSAVRRAVQPWLAAAAPNVHNLTHLAPVAAAALAVLRETSAPRPSWLQLCVTLLAPPIHTTDAHAGTDVNSSTGARSVTGVTVCDDKALTAWLARFRFVELFAESDEAPALAAVVALNSTPETTDDATSVCAGSVPRAVFCGEFPLSMDETKAEMRPVRMESWEKLFLSSSNSASNFTVASTSSSETADAHASDIDDDNDAEDNEDDGNAAKYANTDLADLDSTLYDGIGGDIDDHDASDDAGTQQGNDTAAPVGSTARSLSRVSVLTERNLRLARGVSFLPGHAFAGGGRFDSTLAIATNNTKAEPPFTDNKVGATASNDNAAIALLASLTSTDICQHDSSPAAPSTGSALSAALSTGGPVVPARFSFVELFAGVGGFRLGLQALGGVCVAACEIEHNARAAYAAAHGAAATAEAVNSQSDRWMETPLESEMRGIAQTLSAPMHDTYGGNGTNGKSTVSPSASSVIDASFMSLSALKRAITDNIALRTAANNAQSDANGTVSATESARGGESTLVPVPALLFPDVTALPGAWLPPHAVLTAGFPCQPFSRLGAQPGMGDRKKGALFLHVARLAAECKPPVVLLENVPGLVTIDNCKVSALSHFSFTSNVVLLRMLHSLFVFKLTDLNLLSLNELILFAVSH